MSTEWYIWANGKKISVNEDVYRAYYRPIWREAKRKEIRNDNEYSYEQILENGYDIQADCLVDEIVVDKLFLDDLRSALAKLTNDERALIEALFFNKKSERVVASERGVQRNTIVYHKNKILGKLRKYIENL